MSIRDMIAWAAQQYGANAGVLDGMAKYESSYNPGVQNNWDSNAAAGTPSYGLMQFIRPTFQSFSQQAKQANPNAWNGLGPLNWRDPKQQALTAAWAIKNGYGSHWSTYSRAQQYAQGYNYKPHGGGDYAYAAPTGSGTQAPHLTNQQLNILATPTDLNGTDLQPGGRIDSLKDLMQMQLQASKVAGGAPTGFPTLGNGNSGGGRGGVPPRRQGETGQEYLDRLATSMFGLRHDAGNSQTTGGQHSANSYHYQGQATDFGDALNSWDDLNKWFAFLQQHKQDLGLAEILNEGDHIHAATLRSRR